jgi:hypothetical protein
MLTQNAQAAKDLFSPVDKTYPEASAALLRVSLGIMYLTHSVLLRS